MEDLKVLSVSELEARKAEIAGYIDSAPAEDIEGIEEEVRAINAELENRKALEAKRASIRGMVAGGAGIVIEKGKGGEMEKRDIKEFRNSQEYIDKLVDAIKKEDFAEVRDALLTTNAPNDGSIAVPDFVYDIVKTAWDKNEIMNLVTKTFLKGNLKVNFEIEGGEATVHVEGGDPVPEEELVEGIVELIPAHVKKWKSFSDEVMEMRGEEFLRYIYDELAYRIIKKMADALISIIAALPQTATSTSPSAALVSAAPAVGTVAEALGELSDEAANPVVVMNKKTWSLFKAAQYAAGYSIDPFEGFEVHFNNTLPAYADASDDDVYMIVGDFGHGAIANFPSDSRDDIRYTFDDITKKKDDLVEVLGKVYVALGVVADKSFTLVAKPAEI